MRAPRRVLAALTVALAGALCVPASAVSAAHPAAAPHVSITAIAPRVYLWPAGSPAGRRPNTPRATKGPQQLAYGGGTGGHGVLTQPAVYLVFWGSQWSKTDPYAGYERNFFTGLYGRGDDWTGSQSQYCEAVARGSVDCARNAVRVGVPLRRQVLKGVWFDDSAMAVPTDAGVRIGADGSGDSVAQEAMRAAVHFGNTTGARNRNAIYLINEPSHFNSTEFGTLYCAYHSAVASSYGTVAYSAIPYLTDVENPAHEGLSCGQNYVNKGAAGMYDGVSIVAGHEYLEAVTDPWPATGWVDSHGSETGDKCAWRTSGPGSLDNIRLTTGTFAVQGMWSNLANNGQGECVTHQR